MAEDEIGVKITGDISDILGSLEDLVSQLGEITDKVIDLIINVDSDQLVTADAATDEVTESLNEASSAADGLSESLDGVDTTNLDDAKESADALSESLSGAGAGGESTASNTGGSGGVGGVNDEDLLGAMGGAAAAFGGITLFDDLTEAAGGYADSWARIGSVMGQTGQEAESAWSGAVSQMADNTGRRAGAIREYIAQMGVAGVTSQGTLIDMFTGISGAAFATGNSVESVTNAYRRVIATGTLGARQLMALGLSEQDVMNATGMTLDQVNEKLGSMDSNSRAAFMANIVNAKYAGAANENYKNSWQHVNDQMGAAWDMFMRVFGEMMLPIVIPAMQILTELVKGLATWFNGLNSDQKLLVGTILALSMGFIVFIGVVGVLIPLIGAMNFALLASPWFWLAAVVIGVVAAFLYFYNTNEQFRASMDGTWAALSGFGDWLQGGFNSIVSGAQAIWTGFITTLESSIMWWVTLPDRMFNWGLNAIKSFADGISAGLKPVSDALGRIGALFPHSPPKEGPLADVKASSMASWMTGITTAGMDALGNFNMGNVGIPTGGVVQSTSNSNSSSMQITVDMAGVNIASDVDAQNAGAAVGNALADKLSGQATNAGVNVVNLRR